VIPFVTLGTFFFVTGAAFSHYIAFPYTWKFFGGFETDYMEFRPNASQALSMWMIMLLAFGVIFQMPTIVFFLARMGVVTAGFLIKQFKYAILIIFILGAVLSPGTDVVSQLMMAGPMTVLYIFSIGIAWAFAKRKTT
jgi:sec-independent protein translocase protein TatC